MGERLLLAYTTLMEKAPGAAFRRARELYLIVYPDQQRRRRFSRWSFGWAAWTRLYRVHRWSLGPRFSDVE